MITFSEYTFVDFNFTQCNEGFKASKIEIQLLEEKALLSKYFIYEMN